VLNKKTNYRYKVKEKGPGSANITNFHIPATGIFDVYVWPVIALCLNISCLWLLWHWPVQLSYRNLSLRRSAVIARYRIWPDNVQAINVPSTLTETEISCRCSEKSELYDMTNVL